MPRARTASRRASPGCWRRPSRSRPASPRRASKPAMGLDTAQHSAVKAALREGVSVLTGGPGTGKSRTVATLVALAEKSGKSVALAAPTGRAAKRLEELCDSPASTLHRLLGAQPRSGEHTSEL